MKIFQTEVEKKLKESQIAAKPENTAPYTARRTLSWVILTLAVIMIDLVNTMVQIKNNANGDIVYSLGYGTIFLLIGAIVMVAGAAMILVTDLKNKKK